MHLVNQMSIEALVFEYVPSAKVIHTSSGVVIFFGLRDIYYNQVSISAFWRACNQAQLRPVAKTVFGRIRSIRLQSM